jgi:hypothetical protein
MKNKLKEAVAKAGMMIAFPIVAILWKIEGFDI